MHNEHPDHQARSLPTMQAARSNSVRNLCHRLLVFV